MYRLNLWCAIILLAASVSVSCGKQPEPVPGNRAYFDINPKDRKMMVTVLINDSIPARLFFDTGCIFGQITMDSTFCAEHPSILPDSLKVISNLPWGVAWTKNMTRGDIYVKNITMKLNETQLAPYNDTVPVADWKGYMGNPEMDGFFSLPQNDTTHIWEINFEHNYLEIHNAAEFKMPEDCHLMPLVNFGNFKGHSFVEIPMKLTAENGDTITIKGPFCVDSGLPDDVVIVPPTKDLAFFENKEAVWLDDTANASYKKRYTVNATLFDDFEVDSMRIYTLPKSYRLSFGYLIGTNFLKRFNVFFDMKNRLMGLQPLKQFERIVNPLVTRYYFAIGPEIAGKKNPGDSVRIRITDIADSKDNFYKNAGLQKGDVIDAINDKLLRITRNVSTLEIIQFRKDLESNGPFTVSVIRDGLPVTLEIHPDPSHLQGE